MTVLTTLFDALVMHLQAAITRPITSRALDASEIVPGAVEVAITRLRRTQDGVMDGGLTRRRAISGYVLCHYALGTLASSWLPDESALGTALETFWRSLDLDQFPGLVEFEAGDEDLFINPTPNNPKGRACLSLICEWSLVLDLEVPQ